MNASKQTESIAAKWARLADAITYALDIHSAQVRKRANTPYIGHLLGVASLVLEHGGDEEQAIAGVLHDAIEDQGVEQERVILARFGDRVATIVRGCTDADTNPKPPWRARKEAYIEHLAGCGNSIFGRPDWKIVSLGRPVTTVRYKWHRPSILFLFSLSVQQRISAAC